MIGGRSANFSQGLQKDTSGCLVESWEDAPAMPRGSAYGFTKSMTSRLLPRKKVWRDRYVENEGGGARQIADCKLSD